MEINSSFGGLAGGVFASAAGAAMVVEGEGVVVHAARGSSSASVQVRRTEVIPP
ncbi:hypothetical protein D9M71_785520 [compost metagenome]